MKGYIFKSGFFLNKILLSLLVFMALTSNAIAERQFKNNLCLGVKFNQGQPQSHLEYLKPLGLKWVREELYWSNMEPRKGAYSPLPSALVQRLSFYKENGIGVIFIIAYENSKAYPNDIVNEFAYARYATYIARQLKNSGVRFVIELWNEPHNSTFAKKEYYGGKFNAAPLSPWAVQYVNMVQAAVKKIKSLDPNIRVITNEDMWISHYHFLDLGLPKSIDGFAVHPYVDAPPEKASPGYDSFWTKPYHVVDKDSSFESAIRRLKNHGLKKLGKTPNIWITEWGWRVGGKGKMSLSPSKVAEYLPKAFILSESAGAETTCWFSSQDRLDGAWGLITNNNQFRPAYKAFVKLNSELGLSRFTCELETTKDYTRSFLFENESESIVASWDSTPDSSGDTAVHYKHYYSHKLTSKCLK